MHGYLMLTEARSGSNWLGSLAGSAGTMGNQSEWLDKFHSGADMYAMPLDSYMQTVIKKASTPNGRFAIALFPRYLFEFREAYGRDFIDECRSRYQPALINLRRHDVLRQAISFARARQTKQYASHLPAKREARYDFGLIAQCYFYIRESNTFWNSYLDLRGLDVDRYVYEDLLSDPSEFVDTLAKRLEVDIPQNIQSSTAVQRDVMTEEWVERFQRDMREKSPLDAFDRRLPIKRSAENFARLAGKKLTGHYPFKY